jgi:CRP-like cAMP-binding protein
MIVQVQREIGKLEVFKPLRVSADAELHICRIMMLRQAAAEENIIEQGAVGVSFFVILEGVLERGPLEDAKEDGKMLAGEIFGQEALVQKEHVNEFWVISRQTTKLLEVKKEHYERYVRPMQLAEWRRVALLVSEMPFFNEPGEVWEGNRLERLLRSMQLRSYLAGSLILQEGDTNKFIYFILSGHCHITKQVEDERSKQKAAMLPSPLRSNASIAVASASSSRSGGRAVDIVMLYRGSLLDVEGPLEMKPASFTATAISHVEVACIDANEWIHVDQPVSALFSCSLTYHCFVPRSHSAGCL